MEVLVGHIIHFFMFHPEAMAVLARVYDFIKLHRPGLHRFSFQLRTELEVVHGAPLCGFGQGVALPGASRRLLR
jgi:hypothetical protein